MSSEPGWGAHRATVERSLVDIELALGETEQNRRQLHESLIHVGRLKQEVDRIGAEAERMSDHVLAVHTQTEHDAATRPVGTNGDLETDAPVQLPPDGHRTRATVSLERVSFDVVVDTTVGDAVSDDLALGGSVNQDLVSLMLSHLRPGDKFLDLGAHVGTFTLAAAAAGAQALAVEASGVNVALLREGASANLFTDVVVVHAAVSDRPGPVEFLPQGPWGVVVDESRPGTIKVPGVTVTELVNELRWTPLAFVKLDLEGSELRAFRGMEDLLSGPAAPPLLYESHMYTLAECGTHPAELISHLAELGYHSYLVDRPRLVHVTAADLQPHTVVDYLAVKQPPEILSVDGWEIVDQMSFEELVLRAVAECNDVDPTHRAYIVGAVSAAGDPLASHPDILGAIRGLRDDPHEGVRELVRSRFPDGADTGNKESTL